MGVLTSSLQLKKPRAHGTATHSMRATSPREDLCKKPPHTSKIKTKNSWCSCLSQARAAQEQPPHPDVPQTGCWEYVPCKEPSGFNSYTLPCPGLCCGAEPLQDVAGQSQALPTHISISNSRFTHGQQTLSHWQRAGRLILCLSAAGGTAGTLATPEPATAPAVARGQGWMSWP